jgi:hypothetical protein
MDFATDEDESEMNGPRSSIDVSLQLEGAAQALHPTLPMAHQVAWFGGIWVDAAEMPMKSR